MQHKRMSALAKYQPLLCKSSYNNNNNNMHLFMHV